MSFIKVNQITLHYVWDGAQAGMPLVFINSLGTNLHLWDALVPCLPAQYRFLRYDKRGHGLSDTPPAPYTIRDHSHDLAALLDQLRVEKAVVVGISVGGLIAMDYAIQYPKRVLGLILCDTAPRIGSPEGWSERIQAVREQGMPKMASTIMGRWFAPTFADQRPADYRGLTNMLLQTPVEGYLGTCAALRDADLQETVGQIKVPSLVLCGAQDISTPPDLMRELAKTLPKSQFQVIEGAAHLPCVEQPEAMAAVIQQFLQEVEHV